MLRGVAPPLSSPDTARAAPPVSRERGSWSLRSQTSKVRDQRLAGLWAPGVRDPQAAERRASGTTPPGHRTSSSTTRCMDWLWLPKRCMVMDTACSASMYIISTRPVPTTSSVIRAMSGCSARTA